MKQIPKQTPITKSFVYNTIATGPDGMNEYLQVYVFNSLGNSEYTLQFNQSLNKENVSSKMRFKNNQNEYRKMFHTALLSYLYVKYF